MQEILTETLGVSRSIGFISQLLTKSGQLAGEFLSGLNYAHLDAIIALRVGEKRRLYIGDQF